MFKSLPSVLIILVGFFLIPAQGWASSASKLVNEGNTAFAMRKYDRALEAYEKAALDAPESAYIYFNKGAAYYRKKDYAKAAAAFEQAALKSKDIKLEAQSKFNLGVCSFREAEQQRNGDLNKVLAACEKSIRYFQEALKLDPQFKEAAENIEVVRLTMKSILDEIKKQKEAAHKQQKARQKAAGHTGPAQSDRQNAPDELKNALESLNEGAKATKGKKEGGRQNPQRGGQKAKNQDQRAQAAEKNQQQNKKEGNKQEAQIVQLPDDVRAILEEERENKRKRHLYSVGGFSKVDKDW